LLAEGLDIRGFLEMETIAMRMTFWRMRIWELSDDGEEPNEISG
jgi:hypothetical protein